MAERLAGVWMAYSLMLDDFAREVTNAMNASTINVRRLHAWAAVLDTLAKDERAESIHEFIDPIANAQWVVHGTQPYLAKRQRG